MTRRPAQISAGSAGKPRPAVLGFTPRSLPLGKWFRSLTPTQRLDVLFERMAWVAGMRRALSSSDAAGRSSRGNG